MSNDQQAPASKGLPVWAWVGIGCGALMILILVVVMVGGFFVARKVKLIPVGDPGLAHALGFENY